MGPGTEVMRIHHDQFADQFARSQRAHAVTIGQHAFLRRDRFQPDTDEGLALLAHEATHVLQSLRPNAAWRRATQGALQEEEHEAQRQARSAPCEAQRTFTACRAAPPAQRNRPILAMGTFLYRCHPHQLLLRPSCLVP